MPEAEYPRSLCRGYSLPIKISELQTLKLPPTGLSGFEIMEKTFMLLVALFATIASYSQTRCNVCNGHGKLVCRVCGGNGVVFQNYFNPYWGVWQTASFRCAGCWGLGSVYCVNCGGSGSIATSHSTISFKSKTNSPVYHLEDKSKKCYLRSTHFETYKAGSYQIVLSDRCVNCKAQYRNH